MNHKKTHILIFDGGIGTELYDRGFFINRPFEELNLSNPHDVKKVHLDYIAAGAEFITTNTFSVSRPQLKKFDIEHQQEALIAQGLAIAKAAIDESETTSPGANAEINIAFSIGPLGVLLEPLGALGKNDARAEFAQVASFAAKTGIHFYYLLETFSNLDELQCAVEGIRSVDKDRPIIASASLISSQRDAIDQMASRFGSDERVQMLGLNCSEGPSDVLRTLDLLAPQTTKPIIVRPNAGIPRQLNGRYFYMTSPDYLAKYAKRFADSGAAAVGGCCGTGPDHIRAVAQALKMVNARERGQMSSAVDLEITSPHFALSPHTKAPSWSERKLSSIGRKLSEGKKVISVEVNPPKGTDLGKFREGLATLVKGGVEFVNIPDGARASTRVSSLHLAAYVESQFQGQLTAVPHFTTRDRNLIALQSDLLGAFVNGVHDVLLVTGDPPKLGNNREATAVYDIDSIGLTYLLNSLNRGQSPSGESIGQGTGYGIGVASNPTARNLEQEIERWNYKVESGADFTITQPIFDPDSYLRWRDKIAKTYRPHVVGIWPLVSLRNAEFMANEVPGVFVPPNILEEIAKAGDNPAEATKRGVAIARKVMERLEKECEGFCISAPLGRIPVALEVLQ